MDLPGHDHAELRRRVAQQKRGQERFESDMRSRLERLERHVRQQRATNLRVAELVDLVTELLPAVVNQDRTRHH